MKLPPGFDLNSLEVFMLTAELGGMTQSGQHLGMTQSAVSQTIFKLEGALGVKLFDRATRPLALTPSGKLLLQDGAKLLAAAKSLAIEVREGSQRPVDCVTIALAESLANHLTAPLLQGLGDRALRWQLRSGISLLQHHEFISRKIDMLITGSSQLEDSNEVDHFPIMTEDFRFLRSVTRRTAKLTIPSPSMLHLRGGRGAISRSFWRFRRRRFSDRVSRRATSAKRPAEQLQGCLSMRVSRTLPPPRD